MDFTFEANNEYADQSFKKLTYPNQCIIRCTFDTCKFVRCDFHETRFENCALHKIEKRPVVINDQIVSRPMMYVALSYDHRIVDGHESVQFLVRVKELIEDSNTLLLEG